MNDTDIWVRTDKLMVDLDPTGQYMRIYAKAKLESKLYIDIRVDDAAYLIKVMHMGVKRAKEIRASGVTKAKEL